MESFRVQEKQALSGYIDKHSYLSIEHFLSLLHD